MVGCLEIRFLFFSCEDCPGRRRGKKLLWPFFFFFSLHHLFVPRLPMDRCHNSVEDPPSPPHLIPIRSAGTCPAPITTSAHPHITSDINSITEPYPPLQRPAYVWAVNIRFPNVELKPGWLRRQLIISPIPISSRGGDDPAYTLFIHRASGDGMLTRPSLSVSRL